MIDDKEYDKRDQIDESNEEILNTNIKVWKLENWVQRDI